MQFMATVIIPVVLVTLLHLACVWVALGKADFADRLMGFVLVVCLLPGVVGGLFGWMGVWLALHLALLIWLLLIWRHAAYEPVRFSLMALLLFILVFAGLLVVVRETSQHTRTEPTPWTATLLLASLLASLITWQAVWTALSFKRRAGLLALTSAVLTVFAFTQTWPNVAATPKWKYPVHWLGFGMELVLQISGAAFLIAAMTLYALRGKLVVSWVLDDEHRE